MVSAMNPFASAMGFFILLVLQTAFRIIVAADVKDVPVVKCSKPVLTTVAIDEPSHRFYPYFIQLYQCQGSSGFESPNIKQCVATSSDPVKLRVLNTKRHWEATEVTVLNHTSCAARCTANASKCESKIQRWNDQSCKCECLYQSSPPPNNVIKRKEGFRWNTHRCRYECDRPPAVCPAKKIWSEEQCSCVCHSYYMLDCMEDDKYMDPQTCQCKDIQGFLNGGKRPGFLTYLESKILVSFLVLTVLVSLALGTHIICLQRKLTSLQTAPSAGSDFFDAGSDCPSQATSFESAV